MTLPIPPHPTPPATAPMPQSSGGAPHPTMRDPAATVLSSGGAPEPPAMAWPTSTGQAPEEVTPRPATRLTTPKGDSPGGVDPYGGDGPGFIEHRATGTVHVAAPPDIAEARWARVYRLRPIHAELYPRTGVGRLLYDPVLTLCGHIAIRPTDGESDGWVETFGDTALCASCYKAWRRLGRDPARLFEHRQRVVDVDG
jgi:hypothetical protein